MPERETEPTAARSSPTPPIQDARAPTFHSAQLTGYETDDELRALARRMVTAINAARRIPRPGGTTDDAS